MEYFKNQSVNIIKTENYIKVICNQNRSTPGIYFIVELDENQEVNISLTGYKKGKSKARLWIAHNKQCIEFSDSISLDLKTKTLKYILQNHGNIRKIYKVGILFSNPKKRDYFIISDYSFKINRIMDIKDVVNLKKKTSKYLYIYYYKEGNGHKNIIWQLYIKDNLNSYLDSILLTNLTKNILKMYDVVIIDYLALARYNPLDNRNTYLNILKEQKELKKAIYLHDMHEYTFLMHQNLKPDPKNNKPKKNPDLGTKHFIKLLKKYNIRNLISRCKCPEFDNILSEGKNILDNHYYITHHIDSKDFNDYKLKKEYDIVMYGTFSRNSYPFRSRLRKLLSKNSDKFRVKIINRKNGVYKKDLSKILNQSWMAVATKSNFDYLVCKYFEISASKCVVLGDMTDQGKNIWKNNYAHIDNTMSDEMILTKIEYYLNNKDLLKSYSQNMYEIIQNNYTYQNINIKLFSICEHINKKSNISLESINNIRRLKLDIIDEYKNQNLG